MFMDIKVGDFVEANYFNRGWKPSGKYQPDFVVYRVKRVTASRFETDDGAKVRKADGKEIGSVYLSARVFKKSSEERLKEHEALCLVRDEYIKHSYNIIKTIESQKLTIFQLRDIIKLIDSFESNGVNNEF